MDKFRQISHLINEKTICQYTVKKSLVHDYINHFRRQMHLKIIKTIKLKTPSNLMCTKRSALSFCKISIFYIFCKYYKIQIHIKQKSEHSTFNNKSYTYMYVKLYPGGLVIMLTHIIVIWPQIKFQSFLECVRHFYNI